MPVKSSTSHVLKWPTKRDVVEALRVWADVQRRNLPGLLRIGIFGSLVRDDWGVGSDADLVVIVEESHRPALERPLDFDLSAIPVGVDLLVFTAREWEQLLDRESRFSREMRTVQWL